MSDESASTILEHYRKEAREQGLDATSTMHDQVTREKEVEAITRCLDHTFEEVSGEAELLEVGCGNGYLLSHLRNRDPSLRLVGLDFSPDMLEVAREREIERCELVRGDVSDLEFSDDRFDAVVSERCVINLLDRDAQMRALTEIARVLRPGGAYVCIEAFTDALTNLNRARSELGLEKIQPPHHNLWFEKGDFERAMEEHFEIASEEEMDRAGLPLPTFLSSHYFISRVVYPVVTKREVLYNTEFVRFFSCMPPRGNYAPVQLYFCRKRSADVS